MDGDRNLLFAVLAFQNEHLNLAQLSTACRAWSDDKSRSMASVLLEHGWIDEPVQAELERLVERKLTRFGGDVRATLGAVADGATRDAIRDTEDKQVLQTLVGLPPTAGHVTVETMVRPAENRSRYTLNRVHGEGGMGRIWHATDNDLNREVALKELQPEHSLHAETTRRFVREAQVTGQLEHPNIVTVHELGRRPEDDQPFYTMRFVRGQTLKDAVADHHRQRHEGQTSAVDRQRLLNVFVGICQAIGYAHSRRVVHRDLKPENVILGAFGEVVVLDWGLAKLVDQDDHDEDVPTVQLSAEARAQGTILGSIMGTPAYMSPEQAEGQAGMIDTRTDIYGLGAILFEILTGLPPQEGSVSELIGRIASGQIRAPREVDATVPAALNAICAKAMAHSRRDRYCEASELAKDIERWLADEPVSVYREPWNQRLARWARKNRTWTQAAAVALVAVTIVSVVATIWVDGARRREADALQQERTALAAERRAKAEATRRFRQAREVVDTLLIGVGDALKNYPGMQQARNRLLQRAAEEYQRFAEERSDDLQLQAESGRAYIRLGNVHSLLNKPNKAVEAYKTAESVFAGLVETASARGEFHMELANSRTRLGLVHVALGQTDEAERDYRQALTVLEPLVEQKPDDVEFGDALATVLVNLGRLLSDAGRAADAEETLSRGVEVFDRLGRLHPKKPRLRAALAAARKAYGRFLNTAGRDEEAEAIFRKEIRVYEDLADDFPDQPEYFAGGAAARVFLAAALRATGRFPEEVDEYQEAIKYYQVLIKSRPDVPVYRENLALTRTNLGQALRKLGENRAALDMLEQAVEDFDVLLTAYVVLPRYIENLAATQTTLAQVLSELNQQEAALVAIDEAVAAYEDLVATLNRAYLREGLAVARSNYGQILARMGKTQAAEAACRTAIMELETLIDEDSKQPRYRETLSAMSLVLARLHGRNGMPVKSETAYRKTLDLCEQLVAEHPQTARYADRLAWLLVSCPIESLRNVQRAAGLARTATELAHKSPVYWTTRGITEQMSGNGKPASVSLQKSLNLRTSADSLTLFALAMTDWQLGDKESARKRHAEAAEKMHANQPAIDELQWMRNRSKTLLQLNNETSPKNDAKD